MKTSKSRLDTSSVTVIQRGIMQTSEMVLALPALSPEARFVACNFLPDVDEYITQMVDKSSDEQKVAQWTQDPSNGDTSMAMISRLRRSRIAITSRCIRTDGMLSATSTCKCT